MSQTLSLYRLQNIDSRIKQVTSRIKVIEDSLENNLELNNSKQQLDNSNNFVREITKLLAGIESDSSNLRIKLETLESTLYGGKIKIPKELQDLQKEIQHLKNNLRMIEDKQLDTMANLETSQAENKKFTDEYNKVLGKVTGENAILSHELLVLKKEIDSLNTQRLAVLPTIDQNSLSQYDILRQKKSGLAVSLVNQNECVTCGASLTPALAQSVRTSPSIVLCPMCGRILYSN